MDARQRFDELTRLVTAWAERAASSWSGDAPSRSLARSIAARSARAALRSARSGWGLGLDARVDLPARVRALPVDRDAGTTSAPAIPEGLVLLEEDAGSLVRAALTLEADAGASLVLGSAAEPLWNELEPVLAPTLDERRITLGRLREQPEPPEGAVALHPSESPRRVFGGAPADVVVGPYLHDLRDLRRLADHLLLELVGPAPGFVGVRLIVAERWLQRERLIELLSERIEAARELALPGGAHARLGRGDAPGRFELLELALPARDTAELLDAAAERSRSDAPAAASFVHPFLLERDDAQAALLRWTTGQRASVALHNACPSSAFVLGRVAWTDGRVALPVPGASPPAGRAVIDAPFLSPIASARDERARFALEQRPSRLGWLGLGLKDVLARF